MKDLEKIFSNISVSWIDDNRNNIINSEVYIKFLQYFPKLKKIFQESVNSNKSEFERTLRHTFRLIKIYYQLKNDEFKHKSLSKNSIAKIRERILSIDKINSLYLPLILIFHDIGRPFNRMLHTYESAKIVKKWKLLNKYGLSEKETTLLNKVIEYHLLIGTIYTGESTYYAINTLLNDKEFVRYLADQKFIEKYLLLSSTFTILDPFGYFYAQIFDHYIERYSEIQQRLLENLLNWPNKSMIQKKLRKACLERLDWRLACGLRIFQLIDTKPVLSYEFFIKKIKNSVEEFLNKELNDIAWEDFKQSNLSETYLVQLKYILPILMVLASGKFERIFHPKKVKTNLIHFWLCLNQKIKKENENSKFKNENWNVMFEGLPHWSHMKDLFPKFLNKNNIESVIKNAKVQFDNQRKENWLLINF